ncbi:hypothetical protein [Rugosimonospora africana]|uniref:Uncharacterized protein n=1 Tax=Rugosimonospora africana TaxID=556532 RepID=A0A8J3QM88_9ACTN|nr:hypothetical protein [Rugosimonospora africana]GIH12484.1 hypothetical protein Raf01_06560 [Rugosimonospora africana]
MSGALSGLQGMDGGAWQRLCMQVLHREHKEKLVPVPDTSDGDAGLEAYTHCGLAYQCYSPREPLAVQQRYKKHRDKMTEDVGKFIDNQAKLKAMLGTIKIRRWILLVPVSDSKDINVHCTNQTTRLRQAQLSYADPDAFVMVQTLEHYQISYDAVVNSRLAQLHLPPLHDPDFSTVEAALVGVMHRKLSKVPKLARLERRGRYVKRLLSSLLGGREQRDYIRDHYPELDGELEQLLNDLEERLDGEFILSDDPPERMLLRVMGDAEERVRRALPSIRDAHARAISEAQIADWLMRCPLDFDEPEATNAA